MDHRFNFITEHWEGKLQYGEFIEYQWFGVGGPEHPLIKKINSGYRYKKPVQIVVKKEL